MRPNLDNKPRLNNQHLYPRKDSVTDVTAYAKSQLPITNENDLLAILALQQNTLIHISKNK